MADSVHATTIVLLATVITTAPGTVSCVIDEASRRILVQALDSDDPPAMSAQIKARSGRPLHEIVERSSPGRWTSPSSPSPCPSALFPASPTFG